MNSFRNNIQFSKGQIISNCDVQCARFTNKFRKFPLFFVFVQWHEWYEFAFDLCPDLWWHRSFPPSSLLLPFHSNIVFNGPQRSVSPISYISILDDPHVKYETCRNDPVDKFRCAPNLFDFNYSLARVLLMLHSRTWNRINKWIGTQWFAVIFYLLYLFFFFFFMWMKRSPKCLYLLGVFRFHFERN